MVESVLLFSSPLRMSKPPPNLKDSHTTAPWLVDVHSDDLTGSEPYLIRYHKDETLVAFTVHKNDDQTIEEVKANAQLIAAAPALLEACREGFDSFHHCDCDDVREATEDHAIYCTFCIFRRAIDAATGVVDTAEI